MSKKFTIRCVLATVVLALAVAGAQANVFDMPSGQTSLQTVVVGDPGNAPDTAVSTQDGSTGYGEVDYTYSIGKYEVTNAQYCQFLNAKLPTISDDPGTSNFGVLPNDTYGLYNWSMTLDSVAGGINYDPGAATGAKFSPKPGCANWPVVYVSGINDIRFVNWLQNGQGNGDTESGTYTITDGGKNSGTFPDPTNLRDNETPPAGHWVLPSENEWYKAAYYKGGGTNSGYWLYGTQSNNTPSYYPPGTPGGDPTNSANYLSGGLPKANDRPIDVGSYSESVSPYGALDMAGNAMEWTDTIRGGSVLRGGCYSNSAGDLPSTMFHIHYLTMGGNDYMGFRVGFIGVPEPGSFVLLAVIAVAALFYRRCHA